MSDPHDAADGKPLPLDSEPTLDAASIPDAGEPEGHPGEPRPDAEPDAAPFHDAAEPMTPGVPAAPRRSGSHDRPAARDRSGPRAPGRSRAPRGRSRAASAADEIRQEAGEPSAPAATDPADARPSGLRLARLHLRMGLLPLARAELESFAGRDAMDTDALLDLAEVRWRTGDLAGAGEAAHAALAEGREDALALVIAAEAVAAVGRPGEARRLAGRALAAAGGPLEPLFAGMPRSVIWPPEEAAEPDLPSDRRDAPAGRPATGVRSATHEVPSGGADRGGSGPASAAAAEVLAGGLAALGGGDVAHAALQLGVALRLEPGFAAAILEAIGGRASEPHLALVAGDAHRMLGRESEALAAFDRARGRDRGGAPDPDDDDRRPDGPAGA